MRRLVARLVDSLFALPLAARFLLLALIGVPLLPPILAYGLWIDHWPVAKSGHPAFDDLSNLWLGAKAAVSGDYSQLFRRELHEAMIAREFGASMTNQVWSYPPTIMLALMPLGMLPSYAWFASTWILAGLTLFTLALIQRLPGEAPVRRDFQVMVWFAAILVPGTMLCINAGQTGMLTTGILFFGILFSPTRPVLAGAVLALLVAKPHLGLTLPIVLLALAAYRTVVWTGVFAGLYLALTVLVLGLEPWQQFLTVTLPEHVRYVENALAGPEEALKLTVFMLLRAVGLSKSAAMGLHAAMSVAVLFALAAAVRGEANRNIRFLAVALATLLVSPYLLGYELVLAALAIGRVVLDANAVERLGETGVFGLCAMISLGHLWAVFGLTSLGLNPMALCVLASFAWLTYPHAANALRTAIAWFATRRSLRTA